MFIFSLPQYGFTYLSKFSLGRYDFKAGVRFAKLTSSLYLTTTLFTFIEGPAKSTGRWMTQIEETILDLEQHVYEHDPTLIAVWPHICEERG